MFDIALFIFLLLSPIILLPAIGNLTALQFYQYGTITSSPMLQLQFFQFGIVGLFIVSLFQKRVREYKDFWLSLFLVTCLVSIFLHPISVKMSVNIFLGFILYKLVVEHTRNIKLVLIPIAIVGVLNSIFAVLQYFDINLIYNDMDRTYGLMKIENHLGIYQALSIPILYTFSPVLAIIPLIGLVLSKTMTALVGVFACGVYLFRKKIFDNMNCLFTMFFVSISALFGLFIFRNRVEFLGNFFTRVWIWKETIKDLTFTGIGFQRFEKVYELPKAFFAAVYPNETFNSVYSIYLYIIISVGIFSIPIFIWLYSQFSQRRCQGRIAKGLFASCLILLIIGLGQTFMEVPRLVGTIIVIFGLLKITQGGENGCSVKV